MSIRKTIPRVWNKPELISSRRTFGRRERVLENVAFGLGLKRLESKISNVRARIISAAERGVGKKISY